MRKINLSLSEDGVQEAIDELLEYKKDLAKKNVRIKEIIAERLSKRLREYFSMAVADTVIVDGAEGVKPASVTVSVSHGQTSTLVIASGTDAVFVEFGAGVRYNGPAGNSPHPKGTEFGFVIGSYGKGYGKRNVWAFRTPDGELAFSSGVKAQMPMYKAVKEISEELADIVKEVFADD